MTNPNVEAGIGVPDRLTLDSEGSDFLRQFERACSGVETWPLPGGGATSHRLGLLTAQGQADLALGRLVEAHADALAIMAELGDRDPVDAAASRRWAVWAAGPPTSVQTSRSDRDVLSGVKRWCSGATLCTHALVDVATPGGQQLYEVALSDPGVAVRASEWVGEGMARTDTRTVEFRGVPGRKIGDPGSYLARPGFWMGAIGVAACWHGGVLAVADTLQRAAALKADTHVLVHLGATHVALEQNRTALEDAARRMDAAPVTDLGVLARTVRATVERNAVEVMDLVGRALGPGPMAHNAQHARTLSDLALYLRQHHAERDLELLGADLLEQTRRP